MKDNILKSRLAQSMKEDVEQVVIDVQEKTSSEYESPLGVAAESVMCKYQNANKWLDIIKETLLMDQGCVFFSNYVHELAHTMPVRFDKFGDILHTMDMKIPYPATDYIDKEPESIQEAFDKINCILQCISDALSDFSAIAESNHQKAAAISAETLLEDISNEFTNLKRMNRAYNQCNGDIIKFDKWCAQYMNNSDNLID